jgi:Domain of Unknown Function (DUF1521)
MGGVTSTGNQLWLQGELMTPAEWQLNSTFMTTLWRHSSGQDGAAFSWGGDGATETTAWNSQVPSLLDDGGGDDCSGGHGRNRQRLGKELVKDGLQLMQDGSKLWHDGQVLIQNGDVAEGQKLESEGEQLEWQGFNVEMQGIGVETGSGSQCGGVPPVGPTRGGVPAPVLGGGPLKVLGNNTVSDGRYEIIATDVDHGTLTVKDTQTGQYFTVYGDPHVQTSTGGTAEFQHKNATFLLPDGTEITVEPTDNPGVNTIDKVVITKGSDAVVMTGFTTGLVHTKDLPNQGYSLDASTDDGTVMVAKNGDVGEMQVLGGPEIGNDAHVGDIDKYANHGRWYPIGTVIANIVKTEENIAQIERSLDGSGGGKYYPLSLFPLV